MLIAERWETGPNINSGGFAHVYRAVDNQGGPDVAVKVLHSQNTGIEVDERMVNTALEVAQLDHPGIVKVIQVTDAQIGPRTRPVLIMEYVPGGRTLRNTIQQYAPLPVEDALEIIRDLLAALGHAHERGIVHRDLKPENILEDGATGRPRLIDFDLAKLASGINTTVIGTQAGTPPYAAPELINAVDANVAADLYSVGVILHELVTGTQSWCDSDAPKWRAPSSENHEASRLDDVVRCLMRKDPTDRPASAASVIGSLSRLAAAG